MKVEIVERIDNPKDVERVLVGLAAAQLTAGQLETGCSSCRGAGRIVTAWDEKGPTKWIECPSCT